MRNKFISILHPLVPIAIIAFMLVTTPIQAQTTEKSSLSNDWQFDAQIYIWAADFSGDMDLPTGGTAPFDIPFDKLVDNLKMGFYGSFEARKAKWLVFTDIVYLNIETDTNNTPPSGFLDASFRNVKMEGGAINLIGGYNLLSKGQTRVDLIAGARYLDLGSEISFNLTLGDNTGVRSLIVEMGTALDAVIGVKGKYAFANRWSIPYHADIGAGGSDFTWQLMTGVSYQVANWVDVALTYRHMEWDLKSTDGAVNNVNFDGPSIGATFHF